MFESVYELSGSIDAFVLFQSIYLFFYRKISFKWSCVLAIAGYIMAHFLLLEEVFPAWLHQIGWGDWIKNEEEPRGMIIIGTALVSIFYFFHPRLRSFERTLNLMLLLSLIGTFILFHFIMIKGAMRDVERNFSSMLSTSKISDPARYEALCGDLSYNCIKVKNGKIVDKDGIDDVDMTGHIFKKYLNNMTQPTLLDTNVITKENGHMRNYSLYAEKKRRCHLRGL